MQYGMRGFTLIELMIVVLIVGILAAVTLPLMQGNIDKSKWSEACTAAGLIRRAINSYAAETSVATAQTLVGSDLSDVTIQTALDFSASDLEGTYFIPSDCTITSVNNNGMATITVNGSSKANSPTGTYVLQADGKWLKQ